MRSPPRPRRAPAARLTEDDPAWRRILLYEHVRPTNRLLGRLADWASPWTRRAFGPELNRHTESSVAVAGLKIIEIRPSGIWREIVATPQA